jgi:FMN phosphatase YigB (HAD superfamily)
MGIRLGIISNTWHPFYSGFLRSCPELSVHFDHRILSYREGCKKPSTVLFRRALQEAGESPHSCWMIGDSYELDIEPAMKIGMRTIWLLHHPEKEIPLLAKVLRGEKRSPDQVFEDLEQIRTYFSHNIQQGGAHV